MNCWLIVPSVIPWPRSNTGWRKHLPLQAGVGLQGLFDLVTDCQ